MFFLIRSSFSSSSDSLGARALRAAHIDPLNVHIAGMQDWAAFTDAILQPKNQQPDVILFEQIDDFATRQALSLLDKTPEIATFLLECGNLPPYAKAIRQAKGRPVSSILDGVMELM